MRGCIQAVTKVTPLVNMEEKKEIYPQLSRFNLGKE